MRPDSSSIPRTTCPSRAVLREFWLGRLPLPAVASVADHLAVCPLCASVFDALDEKDSIVSKLRRCLPDATPPLDPECERLAAAARLIALESTGAISSSDDTRSLPPKDRPETLEPPRPFGGYELLRQLGYGGMGVVWKARQLKLNRLVALKMIRFGPASGNADRERFRLEGEAIARIRHPNIVEVYDAGEHEGQPYFAMELLEGASLAQRHRQHPYSPRAAGELLHTLALAVQAAHEAGVVHRDLKPSNVLFGADGVVKVADFGLAKLLDAAGNQTHTGDILGTPAYMAPEQARGDPHSIGPRTDVYALGAILYELLAGKAPFRGADRDATLKQVLSREPPRMPHLDEIKPRELVAVSLKCLQKEPRDRYPTATALADDLDRWLRDQPTEAKFPGSLARVRGFIRRRTVLAASLGICGLGAVGGLAGWMLWNPDAAVDDLERRLARGESVTLLGETGTPGWSKWVLDNRKTLVDSARDGAFQIHCWDQAYLELIRDPGRDHYRFRAEVRHEDDAEDGSGRVGLYFGRRSDANRTAQALVKVLYNDIRNRVEWVKNKNKELLGAGQPEMPAPKANLLEIITFNYDEERRATDGSIGEVELFQPQGRTNPRWRSLAVEVSPAEIRLFWDEDDKPALIASREQIEKSLRTSLAEFQLMKTRAQDAPVTFSPRGGLGLCVTQGAASFRNVRVEPLP